MKYELDQTVSIAVSGEIGTIISRAEYVNKEPMYLIRYKCADGRAIEAWWDESALK